MTATINGKTYDTNRGYTIWCECDTQASTTTYLCDDPESGAYLLITTDVGKCIGECIETIHPITNRQADAWLLDKLGYVGFREMTGRAPFVSYLDPDFAYNPN